jgi:trans-L-3-hydroxyproline dehydratase
VILKTIDAHAGGEPLRLVVDGFPAVGGKQMLDRREWLRRHADHVRRALMLEPRGHRDMRGAVFTEPTMPGSHAGLLFMHGEGYAAMSGHAVLAATTIALERGLLMPGGDGQTIVYDTPAGTVRARARVGTGARSQKVESVAFQNVPSFVLFAGLPLRIGNRSLRADVAFGGAFYAIVDAEGAGLGISGKQLPELRRIGMEIRQAVEAARSVVHPLEPRLTGLDGTVFTGPPSDARADLRGITVLANGATTRSPGGTSMAAVMAVLDAMGLLGEERPFVQEGLAGTCFSGRTAARTTVGDYQSVVAEIEGSAWVTGEHMFFIDETDPFGRGLSV